MSKVFQKAILYPLPCDINNNSYCITKLYDDEQHLNKNLLDNDDWTSSKRCDLCVSFSFEYKLYIRNYRIIQIIILFSSRSPSELQKNIREGIP